MKILKRNFLIFIILLHYVGSAQASDDTEYWSTYKISAKVNERINLNLIEQFRLNNNMSNFYTYVQYAGASYKITDYFDTALWYKLVSSKTNQNWSESHRFDIDGTFKFNLDKFKLSNRSRVERNTTKSSWLYRDRIKFAKDIKISNKKITPFISNEFFLDIDPHYGYHENRAEIGFSMDIIKHLKLDISYMCRAKKEHGEWVSANVVGTTLNFSF